MKKYLFAIIAIFLLTGAITATVWWIAPSTPIKSLDGCEIAEIEVFCGSTGKAFTVTDADTVKAIADGVTDTTLRKSGWSKNIDGYSYYLTFIDEGGEAIGSVIVDSADTLRCDPFFYRSSKPLPFDLLRSLEEEANTNE